jgi:hypothetical protein
VHPWHPLSLYVPTVVARSVRNILGDIITPPSTPAFSIEQLERSCTAGYNLRRMRVRLPASSPAYSYVKRPS